jgi:transposase
VGKQRKYSLEFKQRAVALAKELGNIKEAARKLGIPKHSLYNWANPEPTAEQRVLEPMHEISAEEKVRQLERENEQLKKANFILKQAAAFFSQDHLK